MKNKEQKHRDVKDVEEQRREEKGRKETPRSEMGDDKAGSGWIHHTAGMSCTDTNFGPKAVGNEHIL